MKANAPEKIYLHIRPNKEIGCTWHGNKISDTDIEYTRTDAFIEKACEFIHTPNIYVVDINHYGGATTNYDATVDKFRKYMKGE